MNLKLIKDKWRGKKMKTHKGQIGWEWIVRVYNEFYFEQENKDNIFLHAHTYWWEGEIICKRRDDKCFQRKGWDFKRKLQSQLWWGWIKD